MSALSNKKKVRGWKRQIRKIDNWYERSRIPNIDTFEAGRDDYRKIYIDPWYRLYKRNPPLWYFRLIIERMIQIYKEWDKIYKENKTPYDLQIWVFNPLFISSEIVCVKVDSIGELRDNFFNKDEVNKKFPIDKFKSKNVDLNEFKWSLFKYEYHQFKNGDELSKEEIQSLLRKGYQSNVIFKGSENEDTIYSKQVGDVWVGRLRKN